MQAGATADRTSQKFLVSTVKFSDDGTRTESGSFWESSEHAQSTLIANALELEESWALAAANRVAPQRR